MKFIKDVKMHSCPEAGLLAIEDRLARLESERAIREILHHYTRVVDRGDIVIFHPAIRTTQSFIPLINPIQFEGVSQSAIFSPNF